MLKCTRSLQKAEWQLLRRRRSPEPLRGWDPEAESAGNVGEGAFECKSVLPPSLYYEKNFRNTEMLKHLYSEHLCVYHLDPLQALDFNF